MLRAVILFVFSSALLGCGGPDEAFYQENSIGQDEFVLDCLKAIPKAGGHTEGEDAVHECVKAGAATLPKIPGFRWKENPGFPDTPRIISPWIPCIKAELPEEKEACRYIKYRK